MTFALLALLTHGHVKLPSCNDGLACALWTAQGPLLQGALHRSIAPHCTHPSVVAAACLAGGLPSSWGTAGAWPALVNLEVLETNLSGTAPHIAALFELIGMVRYYRPAGPVSSVPSALFLM